MLGVEHGAVRLGGEALGGQDGLLGLLGVAVEVHAASAPVASAVGADVGRSFGPVRLAGIGLVDVVGELLEAAAVVRRQAGRQDDADPDQEVTEAVGLEAGHALAGQAERAAGLRLGRDAQHHAALEGAHRHLGAKERLGQRHRHLALQVRAAPHELGVVRHVDLQVDVAGIRPAAGLAGEPDPLARRDAARDGHLQAPVADLHQAGRAVVGLLQRDVDARLQVLPLERGDPRLARRTGGLGLVQAKAGQDVGEVEAAGGLGAGRAARAAGAGRAVGRTGRPEERLEEVAEAGQVLSVAAVLETDARTAGSAEPGVAGERVAPAAAGALDLFPVGPQLVVRLALLGIAEHLVGLVDLLEACLRGRVTLVQVRVVGARELAKGLLDVGRAGVARDPQGGVVVAVFHRR